jgi:hypothetical protein
VKVTERRTAEDFAVCMRDLTDIHYSGAERIRVVLDNLLTHSAGALYQTFPARIDSYRRVVAETAAWEKRRNAELACIKWMFTTEKARAKMGRAYPNPLAKSGRTQRVKTPVTRYLLHVMIP